MAKLTLAETRSAMSSAWAGAREAATRFGGSPRTFFAESLRQAYEAIRAEADRTARAFLSPADQILASVADRRARADYIEDHFQRRHELATLDQLETNAKAAIAAEFAELEMIEAYAAETRGPVFSIAAAPVRKPAPRDAWTLVTEAGRVDAGTLTDLRGICGDRRRAA